MDTINGKWIADRLGKERGAKARLAEHLGISRDQVSKILSGTRQIQAKEILALLEFFNVSLEEGGTEDLAFLRQAAEGLNEEGRRALCDHLQLLLSSERYTG